MTLRRILAATSVVVVLCFTAATVLFMLWIMIPPSARRTRPMPTSPATVAPGRSSGGPIGVGS